MKINVKDGKEEEKIEIGCFNGIWKLVIIAIVAWNLPEIIKALNGCVK